MGSDDGHKQDAPLQCAPSSAVSRGSLRVTVSKGVRCSRWKLPCHLCLTAWRDSTGAGGPARARGGQVGLSLGDGSRAVCSGARAPGQLLPGVSDMSPNPGSDQPEARSFRAFLTTFRRRWGPGTERTSAGPAARGRRCPSPLPRDRSVPAMVGIRRHALRWTCGQTELLRLKSLKSFGNLEASWPSDTPPPPPGCCDGTQKVPASPACLHMSDCRDSGDPQRAMKAGKQTRAREHGGPRRWAGWGDRVQNGSDTIRGRKPRTPGRLWAPRRGPSHPALPQRPRVCVVEGHMPSEGASLYQNQWTKVGPSSSARTRADTLRSALPSEI